MRVLLGMILGAALTVLGAYFVDHSTGSATTATGERPMVNWDVVEGRWRGLRADLQELGANVQRGWHRLVG